MIADRLKVRVDILMPFQKESPAVLNSKFLNKVKIQSLIPQTELNYRILNRTKAFSKLISSAREPSKTQFPSELSFSIPSGALKSGNPIPNGARNSNFQFPAAVLGSPNN